jgi:tetratricopeptide (TPR) repeat protein
MKPTNADARIDMGVCYYNLKQYDKAIAEMEKALKNSPNHQIGHLNLGIVNLGAGNLDKSKEWFQKAVNINPNNDIGKRAQELLQSHQ